MPDTDSPSVISIGAGMEPDKVSAKGLQVGFEQVDKRAYSGVDAINNHTGWYVAHGKLP